MLSVNEVYFAGFLGRDAEVKTTKAGKEVASFSICHTQKSDNKEYTTWLKVNAFQSWLVDLCKNLKRGDNVFVKGQLSIREYTDKENRQKLSVELLAQRIAKVERTQRIEKREGDPGDEVPNLDDIPF